MKKIFSNLLFATASLTVIGATSLSIVSCGSTTDNTNKYIYVLKQAISQVITAKRQESAKITTKKVSFTISIDDISKAAAKIITQQKLNITTSYFKHLYLFGKFIPESGSPYKNTVEVTNNNTAHPTAITIIYYNYAFNKKTSTTAQPQSTLLGEITINIKQRHLLFMKKLISTINYDLSNTAYFHMTKANWTAPVTPAGVSFIDGETGAVTTGANVPKKWLAISQDPKNFAKIIAVSAHGVWYSQNAGKTFTSAFFTSLTTPMEFNSHGTAINGALSADSAKISWGKNETAIISISRTPNSDGIQPKTAKGWTTWNVAAVGELMVARLVGTINDTYVTNKVNTIAPVFYTGGFGNKTTLANGFRLDKDGNLFWATTVNINEDLNYQGTYEMSAADISKVSAGSVYRPTATVVAVGRPIIGKHTQLLGMTISPDEKNLWTYWTSGYAIHNTITNGRINSKAIGDSVNTSNFHNNPNQATTAIASNTGLYYISGGNNKPWPSTKGDIVFAGFVSNDTKTKKAFHTFAKKATNGFWSYGYNGTNAYEILSTGNANQIYIIDPNNKSGQLTPATTGDFAGYAPYGTIANPDSWLANGMGIVINPRNIHSPSLPGSIYWLPADHSTMTNLSKNGYITQAGFSASFGKFGTLVVGNQIYDINGINNAPHKITMSATTGAVGFSTETSNAEYFKLLSENGISSINLTGVTITYKGSSLTWSAPSKFI